MKKIFCIIGMFVGVLLVTVPFDHGLKPYSFSSNEYDADFYSEVSNDLYHLNVNLSLLVDLLAFVCFGIGVICICGFGIQLCKEIKSSKSE